MEIKPLITHAKCPYCERKTACFAQRLGDHRVPGGVCDGSGKKFSSTDIAGRAVLIMENGK